MVTNYTLMDIEANGSLVLIKQGAEAVSVFLLLFYLFIYLFFSFIIYEKCENMIIIGFDLKYICLINFGS